MLGSLSVIGSITTTQNMYLNGVNSKIGIALGSAESFIQTAGLKTTNANSFGGSFGDGQPYRGGGCISGSY